MKFVVLGTSEFTIHCSKALLDSGAEVSLLVSMPQHSLPLNSADIPGFAKSRNIPYCEIEDINSHDSISIIQKYKPDYILSSWPKILKDRILNMPRMYCIGTHPTELPYNKGRHPLHWMIVLGFHKSKLSFFRMDEGVDTGRLLLQMPFSISQNDSIHNVLSKLNDVAYKGTKKLLERLKNFPEGTPQDNMKANYWRKRTIHDLILDLRMPSNLILRIVRSFSLPYPCAKLIFRNYVIPISNALIVQTDLSDKELLRIEPGKIIDIEGMRIRVKAEDGIVDLESTAKIPSSLLKAKYIHPPSKYIAEWSKTQSKRILTEL